MGFGAVEMRTLGPATKGLVSTGFYAIEPTPWHRDRGTCGLRVS